MATVSQMKDYLRIAMEMEANLYSNKKIVNMLKSEISKIENTLYYNETQCAVDNVLNDLDVEAKKKSMTAKDALEKLKENHYRVNSDFIFSIIPFLFKAFLIFFAVITVPFMMLYLFAMSSFDLKKLIFEQIDVVLILFGGLFSLIIIAVVYKKIRVSVAKKEALKKRARNKQNVKISSDLKIKNDANLKYYYSQLNPAQESLKAAGESLAKLYSENLLPQKYRNFATVATMFEWLATGRCTSIYGHGGLFDTYEDYKQHEAIITKIDEVGKRLDCIESNQDILISEVQRSNEIAEKTYNSVKNVEKTQERIAYDVEKIKTNSNIMLYNQRQQNAWLEYQTYYQMYY